MDIYGDPVRPGPQSRALRSGRTATPVLRFRTWGDIVTITKATTDAEEREEMLAYMTRVNPTSDTPIRVTEATGVTSTSPDDLVRTGP